MLSRTAFSPRLLCVVFATVLGVTGAHAQQPTSMEAAARNNPAVATDGATLIHGNYCGAGNRPGKPPIDALDLACMNHDACSPTGGLPTCDCNIRLRDEAAAVARDPRQAPELQSLASLTAAAATVMLCKPTLTDAAAPVATPAPAPVTAAATPPPAVVAPAPAAAAPAIDSPAGAAPLSIVPAGVAPAESAPDAAPVETAPPAAVAPPSRSLP